MISSYVGENKEFERQYLSGELEVELTPQVSFLAKQFSDIFLPTGKNICSKSAINLGNIYLFKVNNRNTIERCEICSKLTMKTPGQCH